ncbi:MAG: GAF domain-containing protein [Anaerolineae bacterium]|nr:GAF domain-containing protein [Anaerolineae bacterium]
MIRKRLLVWFVVIALLPVIGVGIGTSLVSYVNGRQQSIDRLESVAARKELAIQGWVESLQQELLFASQTDCSPRFVNTALRLGNENKDYVWYYDLARRQLETYVNHSPRIEELFLVDLEGEVVVSTDKAREGQIYEEQPLFQRGLLTPATELPFHLLADAPGFVAHALDCAVAVVPVVREDGQLMGIMGGRARVDELHTILDERTGLGETGKAYLVDAEHAALAGTYLLPGGQETHTVQTSGIDAAIEGGRSGSGVYADARGTPVLGVNRWLSSLKAVLAVEQESSEALRAVLATTGVNLVIALAAVALAVAASLSMTRSIADPIVDLADTATEISKGALDRRADVERDDEIGALGQAFNSMTAQLRDLINSLEQRVEERTHALQKANLALEQRAVQLQTSAQVGREITSILNIDVLLPRVVEMIREAFGYYHVQVFLVDRDANELVLRASSDNKSLEHQRLNLGIASINARAAQTGEAVLANDVSSDPEFLPDGHLPETRSELVIPLRLGNQVIGTLDVHNAQVGAFSAEDVVAIQSLGDQIVVAIENAHLYEQSRELAVLEERTRLARDLHDSVTQSLYSLVLLTEGWRRLMHTEGGSQTEDYLGRIGEIGQQALREMRLLIHELRPPMLEQEGLVGAVRKRLDAVEKRVGIEARVVMDELVEVPLALEEGLYWITQEALNNALKHAGATKETVRVCIEGERLVLEIADDGQGFDPEMAKQRGGMGLVSMRERAREMCGTLTIESSPGHGTTVRVSVPTPVTTGQIDH